MSKKIWMLMFGFIAGLLLILPSNQANASGTYKGEFISFYYENNNPIAIAMYDSDNHRIRHELASDVQYYMNGVPTNASSFKKGVTVQVVKVGNVVVELRGSELIEPSNDGAATYVITGYVSEIDPNGMYIKVKVDNQGLQDFYINRDTQFFRGEVVADLSMLYEGDRVKIKLPNQQSSTISVLEINQTGMLVENIYKGTIKNSSSSTKTMTVENAQKFENWMFSAPAFSLKTFSLDNNVTIYRGNVKMKLEDLSKYKGSEVYFVTMKNGNSEIVKKIVVFSSNARILDGYISAINTSSKFMQIQSSGSLNTLFYHDGSIFIRHGRLVDDNALAKYGTAFAVTDGLVNSTYAQIVSIMNEGFSSPNMANHTLYFGELADVDYDRYTLRLSDVVALKNNYWQSQDDQVLAFSDGTSMKANENSVTIKIMPNELETVYKSTYGYFYVKNGHIQAMHLIDPSEEKSSLVIAGTVSVSANGAISLKNVSQWQNGEWLKMEGATIQDLTLAQTFIIKNGKAVDASQIKAGNRVVVLTSKNLEARVLLINE